MHPCSPCSLATILLQMPLLPAPAAPAAPPALAVALVGLPAASPCRQPLLRPPVFLCSPALLPAASMLTQQSAIGRRQGCQVWASQRQHHIQVPAILGEAGLLGGSKEGRGDGSRGAGGLG